jgi:hypothetical protein
LYIDASANCDALRSPSQNRTETAKKRSQPKIGWAQRVFKRPKSTKNKSSHTWQLQLLVAMCAILAAHKEMSSEIKNQVARQETFQSISN